MPTQDRTRNAVDCLSVKIDNLTDNTIRFRWTESEYMRHMATLRESVIWRDLPRWAREYLEGYRAGLFTQIRRRTILAFLHHGREWIAINDDRFGRGAYTIRTQSTHRAHVWIDSPQTVFSELTELYPEK